MLNVWGGAETWANLPEYPGGLALLIVCIAPILSSNIQIYFSVSSGKVFQRQYYDGYWHEWVSN